MGAETGNTFGCQPLERDSLKWIPVEASVAL